MQRKKILLAKDDKSGTPKSSRRVIAFSRWLTQKDQISLVEKDIEGARRFEVTRQRLSGGQQQGFLVVGVTAITFLNSDDCIVFVHPFKTVAKYKVESDKFEYELQVSKKKALIYAFVSKDCQEIINRVDKANVELKKAFSADQPSMFDATEGREEADASAADLLSPGRKRLGEIDGMRFNVKLTKKETGKGKPQNVVLVVNSEGIMCVDPSHDGADDGQVMFSRYPWEKVLTVSEKNKKVVINFSNGNLMELQTADSDSLIAEMSSCAKLNKASSGEIRVEDSSRDVKAIAIAAACIACVDKKNVTPVLERDDTILSPRKGVVKKIEVDEEGLYEGFVVNKIHNVRTKDYAAKAFAQLRKHFGVKDKEYANEWSPQDFMNRRTPLTPGVKGGKWILQSPSAKYLAIELTVDEAHSLQDNLPRYHDYVTKNPDNLLMKVIGIHRIITFGVYFAVFINPTPPGLNLGSTTYSLLTGDSQRSAPMEARGKHGAVLYEKDFVKDHRTVFVPYRAKKLLLKQIAADATFLALSGLQDYSLSVSIYNVGDDDLEAVEKYLEDNKDATLYLSPLEDELYVISLINIFTETSKKTDIKKEAQEFYDFAKRRVVTSPDPEKEDIAWEKETFGQDEETQSPKSPRPKA